MSTPYRGIDYSLGRSNVDRETGIHFGVISQNSVNPDCLSDVEYDYGKPHCPNCGNGVTESSDPDLFADYDDELDADGTPGWFDHKDYTCIACQACYWSDSVFPDESIGWNYLADGYQLADCLDNDIFVLESPYWTYAQYCSPCVPGAGNLDAPVDVPKGPYHKRRLKRAGFPRTYALGHDWFERGIAPYPVFRVSDGSRVLPTGNN